ADYADGIILQKGSSYYKVYYDFKLGKYLLTDGKNDIFEIRGEANAVKAEQNGTAYDVEVSGQKLRINGEDYFFQTPYAFDAATGKMNGKKTKILSNNQIQIEVPALPRRGFYDVKVVNPD
ncbi:hypothetical protein, partial [Bacillus licheniformis]|uniref:hypothetical protein n=1 Tax=Bacillus licheniformis TaxID=1402 RepID=UPI00163B1C05